MNLPVLVELHNQFFLLFAKKHCCLLNPVTALAKYQLNPSLNELNLSMGMSENVTSSNNLGNQLNLNVNYCKFVPACFNNE